MSHLKPAITFLIPIQSTQNLIIEQINTIFKFAENYDGLCDILTITDEMEYPKLKLALLAAQLNKANNQRVRTRKLLYTSRLDLLKLIEAGINQALGQKIVVVTNKPEELEKAEIGDFMQRDIMLIKHALDLDTLQQSLA